MIHKALIVILVFFILLGSSTSMFSASLSEQYFSRVEGMDIAGMNDGETIYVDDNNTMGPWDGSLEHPYQHVQDGVDNASFGDTVFVFAGDYVEKVEVRKNIVLRGEDKNTTFIRYFGNSLLDHIVLVTADEVIFSNFTVSLLNGTCPGIVLNTVAYCSVINNIIRSSWGINVYNSNQNIFSNNSIITVNGGIIIADGGKVCQNNIIKYNTITNSGNPGLEYNFGIALWSSAKNNIICDNYFYDCTNHAIYSQSPYNNTIERNVIQGNISKGHVGIGIFDVYSRPGNFIRQNDISGCINGIATAGDYFTISDNILHDNTDGMYLAAGYYLFTTVTNNTFINNDYGLYMVYALFDKVEGNIFHGNFYPLFLEDCMGLKISFNNFTENFLGIVAIHSLFNIFYRNNFMGNNHYVLSSLSWNIWWRNYWDKPHLLPKLIIGLLPFIQFDWRPALQPN